MYSRWVFLDCYGWKFTFMRGAIVIRCCFFLVPSPKNAFTLQSAEDEPICVACLQENFPDPNGSHKCVKCGSPVNALPGCSVPAPASTEGFGEARLCRRCTATRALTYKIQLSLSTTLCTLNHNQQDIRLLYTKES